MDSNQVYQIVLYAASKNLQQGYVSPSDFYTIINAGQIEYFNYLIGEFEKFQAGRPIAPVEVGDKESLRQTISPLIYQITLTSNVVTGIASYPSDFDSVDAMWEANGFYNIRFTPQQRLASVWQSVIDPVVDNPIYTLREAGIQFYPENIGSAKMSYVRTPPSIVWGYTLDSNGIPVWNPATSQNPVWSDGVMMEIIARALRLIGVNLQSSVISQYANEVKQLGQ